MPIKVGTFIESFYPNIGGAEKRAFEILSRLNSEFEVDIFTPNFNNYPDHEKIKNLNVNRIIKLDKDKYFRSNTRQISGSLKFANRTKKVIMKEKEYDIYLFDEFPLFHIFHSISYLKNRNRNIIVQWHEILNDYYRQNFWLWPILTRMERKIVKLSDLNILISDVDREKLNSLYNAHNSKVIPNGIHYDLLSSNIKKEYGTVLYVGRMMKHKRFDLFINIAKKFSDLNFVIIGNGPEKNEILKQAKGLKNIKIISDLSEHELIEYYQKAWLFLNMSEREGFSISSLEAMGAGVPVLYLNSNYNQAIQNIIKDGVTGYAMNTIDQIAEKIRALTKNEELWKNLSKNCLESSKNFDWNKIAKDFENTMISVLNQDS